MKSGILRFIPAFIFPICVCASPETVVIDSIKAPAPASIVRAELTAAELGRDQPASIELRLRNFSELDARIQRGEIVSGDEMAARYYPTRATWAAVADWATSQGLSVQAEDVTHMTVFAHGQVSQLAQVFQTRFSRVKGSDGEEYSSAIVPPSVPAEFAASVAGIRQLQPHIRMKPMTVYDPVSTVNAYGPQYLLDAYNASSVGDGTGQIVAIYGFQNPPNVDDLTAYWAAIGSPHTMADVTIINPLNYAANNDAAGSGQGAGAETTMDVEIVSGLCPGAQIRLYCMSDFGTVATMILADLKQFPGIHQLSISAVVTGGESQANAIDSQYFAALTAQGVTVFAGSGDGGSNPDWATGGVTYNASSSLAVSYPASDPYVTGVGGTQQDLNFVFGNAATYPISGVKAEVAWTEGTNPVWVVNGSFPAAGGGSGGGISTVFTRPAWQTGPGLPAGNMRCVPDVAAQAQGGLFTYIGGPAQAGGTSESTPIWAAMCAIINESLQAKGDAPIGLLNAKIYPLSGTSAISYITRGWMTYEDAGIVFPGSASVPAGAVDTNGAYGVGPAYDLITGLGIPNVARLAAALASPAAPTITTQPQSQSMSAGAAVSLNAGAEGSALSYQWSRDGTAIAGETNATLNVDSIGTDQGGTYVCTVTNALGSTASAPAVLDVISTARLVNISARANVGTGADILIAGFVVSGDSASTPMKLLVRGIGPSLASFKVSGFLENPILAFFANSKETGTNSNWLLPVERIESSGVVFGPASVAIMGTLGAFPFAPSTSADAAFVAAVPVGAGSTSYTAQISGVNATGGVALVEVYNADSALGNAGNTARLVNISARANVGQGPNVLIAGFVVSGSSAETILIRGIGPTLETIGVAGALAKTTITVCDNNQLPIATNTGWSTAPIAGTSPVKAGIEQATASIFSSVGAFQPVSATSADSAMVITLPPGAYTVQVAGKDNATGVALAELYEMR